MHPHTTLVFCALKLPALNYADFHNQQHALRLSGLISGVLVHSLSLLYGVPLCEYVTIHLSILHVMDI